VVVLGATGRNFGAGMSGGVAYVLDAAGDFAQRVNRQMVEVEVLSDPVEIEELQGMIRAHLEHTGSARARQLLGDWERSVPKFQRVMPRDYKRVLASIHRAHEQGLTGDEAIMVAFEENARDLSRVGGN
jgi:glutamate synthase (ferredoxin)